MLKILEIDYNKLMEKLQILLVTKKRPLQLILKYYFESSMHSHVEICSDELGALTYIRKNTSFPLVFIYEYEPESYLVEDLYTSLKKKEKDIHIVILNEIIASSAREFFRDLNLFHLKEKDLILDEINALCASVASTKDIIKNESEYVPIDIHALELIKGLENSLYHYISSSDKYIKLYNDIEDIQGIDLKKYIDKGVNTLYIYNKNNDWILNQLRKNFNYLLSNKYFKFELIDPEISIHSQKNEKIIKIKEDRFLDTEYKEEILKMMENVLKVLMKHPKVENILKSIDITKDKGNFYQKKVRLLSVISCFLARELEWNSKTTIEKLVYASFLHDITIAHNTDLLKIKSMAHLEINKKHFNQKQIKAYKDHPLNSANLLENSFSAIPFEAANLILQHHEMPNGKGFPEGMKWDKIAPLSALFIMANDFVTYILTDECPSQEEYKLLMENKFQPAIFKKIGLKILKLKLDID